MPQRTRCGCHRCFLLLFALAVTLFISDGPFLPDGLYSQLGLEAWANPQGVLTIVPCAGQGANPTPSTDAKHPSGLPLSEISSFASTLHPLSVVQSCPAPSGLWIALVAGGPPVAYRRYTYHLASKACYARTQGYSFLLDHTTRIDAEERRKHQLPPHWVKHYILRRWLKYFDWVFWIDLDATIFGLSLPLESFFTMAPKAHLFLPRDAMSNFVFSNDAFLLKNSAWGWTFLARWWAHRLTCPAWDDQGPMWTAIAVNASEDNEMACSPFCYGKRPHTKLYECVDQRFHPALQRTMPWCLHSKHPKRWATAALRRQVRWDVFQCPADTVSTAGPTEM
eukprot:GGOE01046796.1.p1 GENE.GGOE01046796.1~~GGOE01046796.1.p1  ORF type:complete len:337 (+),score=63.78 GGOE01046796.1:57-1067(+)